MKTRASTLAASLLGAAALLSCGAASAQGATTQLDAFGADRLTPPSVVFSPPLEPGWWRAITDALDAMHGLRGRRIPPAAVRQVELGLASAPTEGPTRWLDLPPVTRPPAYRLELRFGPLYAMPVRIEPITASITDARGESGELLGAAVTLPWLVP